MRPIVSIFLYKIGALCSNLNQQIVVLNVILYGNRNAVLDRRYACL